MSLRNNSQSFRLLVLVVLIGGLTILGTKMVRDRPANQHDTIKTSVAEIPVVPLSTPELDTYPYRKPAATQEEHAIRLQRDCDDGNGKACLDLVLLERRMHKEEGERRVYTRICERNVRMEFPPCVELMSLLSHSMPREAAIEEVCRLSLVACGTLAEFFEDNRTARYAFHAHRLVCQKDPHSSSCARMPEVESLVEPELAPPDTALSQAQSCDSDPNRCFERARVLALHGYYAEAAPAYAAWCRFRKHPLEDCSMWLELARWRTSLDQVLRHLEQRHALNRPIGNAKELYPIVERTCSSGDGKSCFFLALLVEIDHPTQVEEAQKIYQRACDLGHQPGCTNTMSIFSRQRPASLLPADTDIRYTTLCFERDEAEACSELGRLASRKFESAGSSERQQERPRIQELLNQTCHREVRARLANKVACREWQRLKRIQIL